MNGYFDPHSIAPPARLVLEKREEIISEWVRAVRNEIALARDLSEPILVHTIPQFLKRVADALVEETGKRTALEHSSFAQEHGGERARVTRYGPDQIIQEWGILRRIVRAKIQRITPLSESEDSRIQLCFDKAIQESLLSYFLVYGRIREQFVAGLTHDLRNPIGAIKLAAELILDAAGSAPPSPEGWEEIKRLAQTIQRASKRSERMIQDMLDASLVQVGEQPPVHISRGDLKDVVLAAVGERPAAEAKRLRLELLSVTGFWDLEALQRSIENLITNAFKYGEKNGPVTISMDSENGRAQVSVHNIGNPIPSEERENLFQVFRRARAARHAKQKGWGIGLALARAASEQMGGRIRVESSIKGGTTFTIDVPLDGRPFIDLPATSQN